jgi:MYXO-CTERM domain-containing protein
MNHAAVLLVLALSGLACDQALGPPPGTSREALAVSPVPPRHTRARETQVKDEILVTYRDGVSEADGRSAASALGHRVERRLRFDTAPASPINRTYLLRLAEDVSIEKALAEMSARPEVERTQPNYLYYPSEIPNDPYFDMQWAHENLGDNTPFLGNPGLLNPDPRVADMDMDTLEAHDEVARRGFTPGTIIVAVIDSGVDYTHPDLAAIMWPGNGYDFYADDSNPMDEDSHGTHVAGAIAAIHNSIGVYGTASNVRIMALRFIGPSGGTTADAIAAINYGVLHGAKVLNNSWGGGSYDPSLANAIDAAHDQGVLFVAAAGNDGSDNDSTPTYPANYPFENVVSVGASTAWGDAALYSNYGSNTVHLFAPGDEIISTTPNLLTGYPENRYQICTWDSSYSVWLAWSGTSMAAPHVSGAAALLYGLAPDLFPGWAGMTPVQRVSAIRQRLMDRSQRWASLAGLATTGGHANLFNLVEEDTTPPAAPVLSVGFTDTRRVVLRTTAPGDDGSSGQANYYDLRVAEGGTFDFDTAAQIIGLWTPSPAGQTDAFTVGGLEPGTTYRFGLKAVDNAANVSALSNVAVVTTPAEIVLFSDDVEGGLSGWTGDWGQTTAQSHSPTHSWTDSPGGNYPNNANLYLVSPEIVANDQPVHLSFWQRYALQANADYGRLQLRTYNGSTWSAWATEDEVTGTHTTWHEWSGTLSATGQRVQLRFWLDSNNSIRADGWYVDDVSIAVGGGLPDTLVVDETFDSSGNWTLTPTWAVQGGVLDDSPGSNYIDNNRSSATFSAGVDLSNASAASLSFELVSCSYEDNYDYLIWEYSLDHIQWRIIGGFTGTPSGPVELDISGLIGHDAVYFRFRSYSDVIYNEAGCRLDNFQIWTKPLVGCSSDAECDDGLYCNGAETCELVSGTCQAGSNPCPETECNHCDEAADSCFDPAGTACGASGDSTCDHPDTCNGSGTCLPNHEPSSTVCRPAAGPCDLAEYCTGSGTCPADSFRPSSYECRASGGVCDVAESCTGSSAACPTNAYLPSTTTCRASAGPCDLAENCTGSAAACPSDAFRPSSYECRASAGVCDAAESCTGSSAACPLDAFLPSSTQCRASAGVCDAAESCTGSSAACPLDAFLPSSTQCRASAGPCDLAENCTGTGPSCPVDAFLPSSTVCRASTGECDPAESCTGSSAACPANAYAPNGSECGSRFCNSLDWRMQTCQTGACTGSSLLQGCNDGNVCTTDSCAPATGCAYADNTLPCPDGNLCNGDEVCAGGACQPGTPLDCDDHDVCTDDGCDPGLGCTATDNTEACDDGDACTTNDTCGGGVCAGLPLDGDGDTYGPLACGGFDCDDTDPAVNPGAFEGGVGDATCSDGLDNDCDGLTDAEEAACAACATDDDCRDGSPCNGEEACVAGACTAGQPLACDDGNPCTGAECDPAVGCVFPPVEGACDDADPCTTGDACADGACVGQPVDCSHLDGACLVGVCQAADGTCQAQPVEDGRSCDDGDACTAGDTCQAGSCQAGRQVCDGGSDGQNGWEESISGAGCACGAGQGGGQPAWLLGLLGFALLFYRRPGYDRSR